jgi:hypothetical protein
MRGFLLVLFFINFIFGSANAQSKKQNPFQRVSVPDSIEIRLEEAYLKNAKNVNAGKNVFNLVNRKDFVFKDGLYSFQGQGPHFPKRIFIFNNGKIYIFENEGASNPKGVLQEFIIAIDKLKLTDKQTVCYSKVISDYLDQETGNTYGSEIKK